MAHKLGAPSARRSLSDERRRVLTRRIRFFVAATITYNVIEAIVAISAGVIATSAALIGFGLDSFIEVASATAVAWQFSGRDPQARERITLRIIAISFFGLAVYIVVEAIRALVGANEASPSTVGIALAAVSLMVMPVLSYGQRRAGRELGSASAVAGFEADLALYVLVGRLTRRPATEWPVWLVLGRPDCRAGHLSGRDTGRLRSLEGGDVLYDIDFRGDDRPL